MQVVAVSTDHPEEIRQGRGAHGLRAQMLSDPKLVVTGALVDGDAKVAGHGKILSLPMDAKAEYLEMRSNTGQHVNEAIRDEHDAARRDEPALAVSQPGANTSGKAWGYRTLGLSGQVAMLRAHWSRAMARVLGVYRAYRNGEPYDAAWVRRLSFDFDDDLADETIRALAELHRDGVFSAAEVRAVAKGSGLLRPGFPVEREEVGDAVQAD